MFYLFSQRAIAGVAIQASLGNLISGGNLRKGRALMYQQIFPLFDGFPFLFIQKYVSFS
jgi:hypothetical protein